MFGKQWLETGKEVKEKEGFVYCICFLGILTMGPVGIGR